MKNLEGIKLSEVKESELEKKSIEVNDDMNYDNAALTEKERLEKLKEDILAYQDFEDCKKEEETESLDEIEDNYDDCSIRGR